MKGDKMILSSKRGKECDLCFNCQENGDDAILTKIRNSDKFICESCWYEYLGARNLIRYFEERC
jgi:hypothetical protein